MELIGHRARFGWPRASSERPVAPIPLLVQLDESASWRLRRFSLHRPSSYVRHESMAFDPQAYGPEVAAILALDGNGKRLMPLAPKGCSSDEARVALLASKAEDLFPHARFAKAAMCGLFLYFSCLDEAHKIAQDISTSEGSYWHGIMHRQEPDPANAAYWFRKVGDHPVLKKLREADSRYPGPMEFIDMCEEGRREPNSPLEPIAREIQLLEWQLLFDWCAR